MNVHTIAAIGLPSNDILVLLSTLRLREQEGSAWRCVDDPRQADVVLVLADSPAARDDLALAPDIKRPIRVAVVPQRMGPSSAGKTFTMPLRARELLTQLRGLEIRLTRIPPLQGSLANSASVVMSATELLCLLRDRKACADRVPMLLRQGMDSLVLIDADKGPAPGNHMRWQSSTLKDLSEFRRIVASGLPLSIDSNAVSDSAWRSDPISEGGFSALLWAIATHDPQPDPLIWMGDDTSFGLDQWPDFGLLQAQTIQMRLAAIISRRAMSASQLAAQAGATSRQVVTFLNACHVLGMLSVMPVDATERLHSIASPSSTRAEVPMRGLGLLMRSIRQALRLGPQGGDA